MLLVSRSAKRFGVWEPWGSSSGVPIPGKASGAHSQLLAYLASDAPPLQEAGEAGVGL